MLSGPAESRVREEPRREMERGRVRSGTKLEGGVARRRVGARPRLPAPARTNTFALALRSLCASGILQTKLENRETGRSSVSSRGFDYGGVCVVYESSTVESSAPGVSVCV